MPGIVGIYAIVGGIFLTLFLTMLIWFSISFFSKLSVLKSFIISFLMSCLIVGWLLYDAFGEKHEDLDVSVFADRFPELVEQGAIGLKAYYWQQELSDGDYYKFSIPESNFEEFRRSLGIEAYIKKDYDSFDDRFIIFIVPEDASPNWMPEKDCEDGLLFEGNRRFDNIYSRYKYYYCPNEQIGYMSNVRI